MLRHVSDTTPLFLNGGDGRVAANEDAALSRCSFESDEANGRLPCFDQSDLDGNRHRMDPIGSTKLAHRDTQVILHGALMQLEAGADLLG